MKTNKMIVASVVTVAIVLGSVIGVSAMDGQGQGGKQGFGKTLTSEQRIELQAMSESERQAYIEKLKTEQGFSSGGQGEGKGKKEGKKDYNPVDMITDIPMQDVSAIEIDLLEKQYEEEMMSNELYTLFYEMYGIDTFNNIAQSEAQHMEVIKTLLDRYSIDVPTDYEHIQSLYDNLKEKGALSLHDALEVGLSIEIVDIDDIYTAILASDNDDIRTVLVNIGGASYNHMRGFVKALANNNLTTDIDYSDYLNAEDIDTKGPIKVKLAAKLEANGIILPEGATAEALKEKCEKEKGSHEQEGNTKKQENYGKRDNSQNNNDNLNYNKYMSNSTLVAKYKDTYEIKYGSVISKMSKEKLTEIVSKIDTLIENINSENYSNLIKERYNAMLLGLRGVILDNLNIEENFFDKWF